MNKTVIDDDAGYFHRDEGPDVGSYTHCFNTNGTQHTHHGWPTRAWYLARCFFWEHRAHSYQRQITITLQGK